MTETQEKQRVFIQTNNKQHFGALLSKFSIERAASAPVAVELMNVDEVPIFKAFKGSAYLRTYHVGSPAVEVSADEADLQSFTLSRFMPPELMSFDGKAVVIDPDIFAIADINELFRISMHDASILACKKNDAWDSSVMVLDCPKLTRWKIQDIVDALKEKRLDYTDLMQLRNESSVAPLERNWNNLDELTPTTKMVHMTKRLTQPWKTGLTIDFKITPMPKIAGIIPREIIHKLLRKYPTRYLPHPNRDIKSFFFRLAKDARAAGIITDQLLQKEIALGNVRADLIEQINLA